MPLPTSFGRAQTVPGLWSDEDDGVRLNARHHKRHGVDQRDFKRFHLLLLLIKLKKEISKYFGDCQQFLINVFLC